MQHANLIDGIVSKTGHIVSTKRIGTEWAAIGKTRIGRMVALGGTQLAALERFDRLLMTVQDPPKLRFQQR